MPVSFGSVSSQIFWKISIDWELSHCRHIFTSSSAIRIKANIRSPRCHAVPMEARGVVAQSDAIIGGGELTVTVTGDGAGGRNTELALAAAIELERRDMAVTVASLASDGQDGGVDAAGAVVDGDTVARLREAGIDPAKALADNDSGAALGTIGALVAPGPTGTNVNDVYIGIRHDREAE